MRLDKLTSKFQLALADAQSLAVGRDHQFIEPVHVMVALLDQQGGSVRPLLLKAGANVNLLRSRLGEALDQLPQVEGAPGEPQHSRPVWFHAEESVDTPVYHRESLAPGQVVDGPAIVDQLDATTPLWPGDRLTVLDSGAFIIEVNP